MTTRVRKARAKKAVKQALRKVQPEDAREILESEEKVAEVKAAEVKERVPGQVVDGVKTAWTRKDVEEKFPIVPIMSEENIRITWNGVVYQLLQGATHYVPSVIRDAYLHHRRELRGAGKLPDNTGFVSITDLGAGALEPPE